LIETLHLGFNELLEISLFSQIHISKTIILVSDPSRDQFSLNESKLSILQSIHVGHEELGGDPVKFVTFLGKLDSFLLHPLLQYLDLAIDISVVFLQEITDLNQP
jgi:hypothetical protein